MSMQENNKPIDPEQTAGPVSIPPALDLTQDPSEPLQALTEASDANTNTEGLSPDPKTTDEPKVGQEQLQEAGPEEAAAKQPIDLSKDPTPTTKAAKKSSAEEGLDKNYRRLQSAMNLRLDGMNFPLFGTAMLHREVVKPRKEETTRIGMRMPTITNAGIAYQQSNFAKLDDTNEKVAEWKEGIEGGLSVVPLGDSGVKAMSEGNWTQSPVVNNQLLAPSTYARPQIENQVLSAETARSYAMASLGVGIPSKTPLWASGWWVSFFPASDREWVEFTDLLSSTKDEVLRNTTGLAYSSVNAVLLELAVDFAMKHIEQTNIRFETSSNESLHVRYMKLLKDTDISTFLGGFMAANYPEGYPISRSCTSNVGSCSHVIEEVFMIQRSLVVNVDRLEERHLNHMSRNGAGQVSEEEVRQYQDSIPANQTSDYVLTVENHPVEIRCRFGVPSVYDRIVSGKRWSMFLSKLIDNVLTKEATSNRRREVLNGYIRATSMREYLHWTKFVLLGTNRVENVEAMEAAMDAIITSDSARQEFYKAIEKYIETATFTALALPEHHCPACERDQVGVKPLPALKNCIPLDVVQVFFSLAQLRLYEIVSR